MTAFSAQTGQIVFQHGQHERIVLVADEVDRFDMARLTKPLQNGGGKNTRSRAGIQNGDVLRFGRRQHLRHERRCASLGEKATDTDVFLFRFFTDQFFCVAHGKF